MQRANRQAQYSLSPVLRTMWLVCTLDLCTECLCLVCIKIGSGICLSLPWYCICKLYKWSAFQEQPHSSKPSIVCSHDRCLIDSGGHKRQKRDERNAGRWIICQRSADSVHAQQNSHWWTAGRAERAPTACARFFMPFYHFLILISLARVV